MAVTRLRPDGEFAFLAAAGGPVPLAHRSWVNVPAGGHVSAVHWGEPPARVVFLHDIARSARSFDLVALALGRSSVAIDLPGHGRSTWRRDGGYPARRLALPVAEAISSFAPQAEQLVGAGLGARVAAAIAARQLAPALRQVILIDPLDGPARAGEAPGPGAAATAAPRFASPAQAADALALRHPAWPAELLEREIATELETAEDGAWVWRHHPGSLPAQPAAAAPGPGPWPDLAGLVTAVHALAGRPPSQPDGRAAEVPFTAVPGGGGDPVALAPAAVAAAINDLLTA